MYIGILHDQANREHRVSLTPDAVGSLVKSGHPVFIQENAGEDSGFHNGYYEEAGATIVYSREEVFERGDLILKISPLSLNDTEYLRSGQTVFAFHHVAVAGSDVIAAMQEKQVTAIGMEIIEDETNELVIQTPISEIAGQMSVHIGAHYLQNEQDGRGVLFGGIPGVPEAAIVIIGAGVVGIHATEAALGLGGHVVLLDHDVRKLRRASELFGKRLTTGIVNNRNLDKAVRFADVLITAVLVHGARTPHIVTHDHVKSMKRRAVIVDVSIDQGGCVETSRPTSLAHPVFTEENVTHYCVPNMTSNVSRSATYAITNSSLPYIQDIANLSLDDALKNNYALRKGVYFYKGQCALQSVAEYFNLNHEPMNL